MKCRKAFELDLADFVVDPSADAWATFRAHYPACADCATEVAVWDEMQAFLRSGGPGATTAHPPKELLLRYEEQRTTLSAIEVAMVGKHLATCRTCPDELAALRTFDFSVVRRQPLPRPWWSRMREAVAKLRPVVLHPAFAYALVLLLLFPALLQLRQVGRRRPSEQIALEAPRPPTAAPRRITTNDDRPKVVSPPPSEEHSAGAPPDGGAVPRAPHPPPADDPATRTVTSEATQPDSRLAAAHLRPPRGASRSTQPEGAAAGDRVSTARPVEEAPAAKAAPVAEAPAAKVAPVAEAPAAKVAPIAADDEDVAGDRKAPAGSESLGRGEPADADSESDEPRVLGLADTEEPLDAAPHARRAAKNAGATQDDAANDAAWQTIVLAPGRLPTVRHRDLATGVILRVPLADRDVEIRIVGPGGREAAHETVRSRSGPFEVRIRATELVAGTYRVLRRPVDGSASSAPTSDLLFVVH